MVRPTQRASSPSRDSKRVLDAVILNLHILSDRLVKSRGMLMASPPWSLWNLRLSVVPSLLTLARAESAFDDIGGGALQASRTDTHEYEAGYHLP